MAKIIILNAPPGAGKDTIGATICGKLNSLAGSKITKLSFKAPMFEIALGMLGGDYPQFITDYNNRASKEQKQSYLSGMSCREFMIHISENVCKPLFGNDYFGKRLAKRANNSDAAIVTDGGFVEEIHPLIEAGHEVYLIRMHRKGFSFDGDSRSYIHMNDHRVKEFDVQLIDGEPERTVNEIIRIAGL